MIQPKNGSPNRTIPLALAGAGLALALALAILITTGLPDRAALLAQDSSSSNDIPVAAEAGAQAPPFVATLIALDGTESTLDFRRLRGSPVVINFWATWCGPCEEELPALQAVYEARREEGLRFLAINSGETPDLFVPWMAERGLTLDLVYDPDDIMDRLYRVRGLPQTFVVGPEGVIRALFFGRVTADQLNDALDELPQL